MKLRAIKTSFNGGEISKQLFGRVDLESFIASNKQMKNVLPTIYGSAMNRGGTVFVSDNLKLFYNTLQEVTGATNINCVGIDWSNNKYILGCDSGYVVWCDFDFGNVDIKQIIYDGNVIDDITSVAAVGNGNNGFATRYCVGTETAGYWFTRSVSVITEVNLLSSSKTEVYGLKYIYDDIIENDNRVMVVHDAQISAEGTFKYASSYQIYNDTWYVGGWNCKIGESGVSDFAVFPLTYERYAKLVAVCDNVLTYGSQSPSSVRLELGVVSGTVVGAKNGADENIEVYIYKQVDDKYCIYCNIYNMSGELVKEKTVAIFDEDLGINKLININNDLLFIGTVRSVCIYKGALVNVDIAANCLSYFVNDTDQILFCDGSDNVNVIKKYNYHDINKKRVLVPFKINKKINYILEFGEQVVRVYKDRELVTSSGAIYEIGSPYKISDLVDDEGKIRINYTQSVDVLYICHKDFPIQALKRYGDTNWVMEEFTINGGPFGDINSDKNKVLTCAGGTGLVTINAENAEYHLTLVVGNGQAQTYYNQPRTIWYLDGTAIATVNSFKNLQEAVNLLYGTAYGSDFTITVSGNKINVTANSASYANKTLRLFRREVLQHLTSDLYQCRKYDDSATFNGSTALNLFTENDVDKLIRLNYTDYNTVMWESGKSVSVGNIRKSGNNYYKATTSGTTGQIKPTHTAGIVSDGGVSWEYLHSGYGVGLIVEYVSASQVKVNVDGYMPDFSNGTYLFEFGLIGDGIYPNCCAFYKERFVFAISTANGTKICASCAGDYNNFSDNSFGDILPENAITVLLQGQQESSVLWMHALNRLYIGTACEEFVFGEQTIAEVLSPTNVMCLKVSSLGSAKIEPLQVLDELLFVSNNEKQIANFTYVAERDTFRPINMSLMFEHLLHNGVKCWTYTKEPYKTIWFSDKDGNLRSISYDADNKVCAGARHEIGGKVISLAVIPEPNGNYDDLWLVVERVVAGQTVYYTERLSWGLLQDSNVSDDDLNKKQVFCDCAKVFEFKESVSYVTGLYFLEGQMVKVLVDGKLQNDKTVVDGIITLDAAGKIVIIGIGYDWFIETLFFNIGANDGTAQGLPQRVSKLIARCINTRYITAKASGGNKYDVIANESTLTDNDYEIHLPSDYSKKMTISFSGNKPLSACILCIIAEMKTYQ